MWKHGVPLIEDKCVVEVFCQPFLKVFELTKVDYESILVQLFTAEREFKIEVVAMDQSTVAVVVVLPVGKWEL